MKNFNIFGFFEKFRFLGVVMINQYRGGLHKKGGVLGQFADLRGEGEGLGKKEGGVFEGGGGAGAGTLMNTMDLL